MSTPLDQAYINIERAYGEGNFSEALRQAEALLPLLPADRADELAERLQLLMGHIHLYGLGAPERAAGYYQTVHDRRPRLPPTGPAGPGALPERSKSRAGSNSRADRSRRSPRHALAGAAPGTRRHRRARSTPEPGCRGCGQSMAGAIGPGAEGRGTRGGAPGPNR